MQQLARRVLCSSNSRNVLIGVLYYPVLHALLIAPLARPDDTLCCGVRASLKPRPTGTSSSGLQGAKGTTLPAERQRKRHDAAEYGAY